MVRTIILLTNFSYTDGGCIFIDKFSRLIFEENKVVIIRNYLNVVRYYQRISNSLFLKFFRRLPLAPIIEWYFLKLLVSFYYLDFIRNYGNRNFDIIIPSGDDLAFLLAVKLKRKRFSQKLHFSILDLPWTYKNSSLNNWLIKKLYFNEIYNINTLDCISDGMAQALKKYNPKFKIYQNTVFLETPNYVKKIEDRINANSSTVQIGFAGNLRFKSVILQFLGILEIKFDNFIFNSFSKEPIHSSIVVNRGFEFSNEKLVGELKKMDFGFIPMSFKECDKELVETSFPSKAATYINAQIPIIALVPEYSALAKFIFKYRLGIVISDLNNVNSLKVIDELNQVRINWKRNFALFDSDNRKTINLLKSLFDENFIK